MAQRGLPSYSWKQEDAARYARPAACNRLAASFDPRACGDLQFDLPDIGDQVLCLFLAYGLEQGFVIGSMYSRQTPPVQSGDKWHRTFSDGAKLEYDRASHSLTADIPGTANIKCASSITLEAPIIYLRGTLVNTAKDGSPGKSVFSGGMEVMNGGINAMDGDVVASGVSLASHTTEGVEPGDGTSSHPTGGSASSPGTESKNLEMMSLTEALLLQATHLTVLHEKVEKEGNEVDKVIYCLPKIAENMARLAAENDDELEEKAWKYLKEMFLLWLSSPENTYPNKCQKPVWIDWEWAMAFPEAKKDYAYFIDTHPDALLMPNRLFSRKACLSLGEVLKKYGYLANDEGSFDFIDSNWREWENNYYTLKPANGLPPIFHLDGLNITLNKFSFRALANGSFKRKKNGKYDIEIKKIGIFIHDLFNFSPSALPIFDNLRYWSCADLMFSKKKLPGYIELNNEKIRAFQSKFHMGGDFLVLSMPHILENFSGISYVYP